MLLILDQNLYVAITAPVITSQPQSVAVQSGASATFTVIASGLNLSYQWFKSSVPIAGATSSSFTYGPTIYPTDTGSQFYVVVSNSGGLITSGTAVLVVLQVATFIAPPTGTTAFDIIKGALRRINSYQSGEHIHEENG